MRPFGGPLQEKGQEAGLHRDKRAATMLMALSGTRDLLPGNENQFGEINTVGGPAQALGRRGRNQKLAVQERRGLTVLQ